MIEPAEVLKIKCTVNGHAFEGEVPVRQHLADFLRERLGLNGTHLGCEHGVCGACTVLLDGKLVRGCLVLAVQAGNASIETIEGAVESGRLQALIEAFHEKNAAQCGFCSPAMVLTAGRLLEQKPIVSREEVRDYLSGNYCRCTGYQSIVDAVIQTAELRSRAQRGSDLE